MQQRLGAAENLDFCLFVCLLVSRPTGVISKPYAEMPTHHPKILGFELGAIIG